MTAHFTTLDKLPQNATAIITGVQMSAGDADLSNISLRLGELGFVDGETVKVTARGLFSGEPIAVRVGGTTFALRRFEAALVSVSLAPSVQSDAR